MVKRYQKEMDEEAAKQARKDKIWNEAINAAADILGRDTTFGADVLTLLRKATP